MPNRMSCRDGFDPVQMGRLFDFDSEVEVVGLAGLISGNASRWPSVSDLASIIPGVLSPQSHGVGRSMVK